MKQSIFLFLLLVVTVSSEENEEASKKIKGQRYVRLSTVAKVVGGPVPEEILAILRNESEVATGQTPDNIDETLLPHLLVDNVKTVTTRINIPLSVHYMGSDWYRNTLFKFLEQNKINLTAAHPLQDPSNQAPSETFLLVKLQKTVEFRNAFLAFLRKLLFNNPPTLPEDYQASLSQIYQLILLRRIPFIGILDELTKFQEKSISQRILEIFEGIEILTPKYMKSCVTYWLEGLQENVVPLEAILAKNGPLVLSSDNISMSIIQQETLFPEKVIKAMNPKFEKYIGKTLTALISAISEFSVTLTPKLLAFIYLNLPTNTLTTYADSVSEHMIASTVFTLEEKSALAEAVRYVKPTDHQTPHSYFRKILTKVLASKGFDKYPYEVLLGNLHDPSDTYVFTHFNEMVYFNKAEELTLTDLMGIFEQPTTGFNEKLRDLMIRQGTSTLKSTPNSATSRIEFLGRILAYLATYETSIDFKRNARHLASVLHLRKLVNFQSTFSSSDIAFLSYGIENNKTDLNLIDQLRSSFRDECAILIPISPLECKNELMSCLISSMNYVNNLNATARCSGIAQSLTQFIRL